MLGFGNALATGEWVGLRLLAVPLMGWAYRIPWKHGQPVAGGTGWRGSVVAGGCWA